MGDFLGELFGLGDFLAELFGLGDFLGDGLPDFFLGDALAFALELAGEVFVVLLGAAAGLLIILGSSSSSSPLPPLLSLFLLVSLFPS